MPLSNINYANNVIYKIFCKDTIITDLYVGRSCDPVRRKYQHKLGCGNINNYLYCFINKNGGWVNWNFEIIESFPCINSIDASNRETFWINELMATLNINGVFEENSVNKEYKRKWYFENKPKIQAHRIKRREEQQAIKQEQELQTIKHREEQQAIKQEQELQTIKHREEQQAIKQEQELRMIEIWKAQKTKFKKKNYTNIQVDFINNNNNPDWIQANMKNAKYVK
jgi:hypothetical protein